MIETVGIGSVIGPFGPLMIGLMAVVLVVLRAGASMVFFDIVGRFQANRLIKDADAAMATFDALMLDSLGNVQDAMQMFSDSFSGFVDNILPATEAMRDAEIELRKFLENQEDLEAVRAEVIEIGEGFGYTGDQAMIAAAKMAQLEGVLGRGQIAGGAQLGYEFALISGMTTEEAMKALVQLNAQLGFMQEGTTDLMTAEEKALIIRGNTLHVMNQLNTVENRSMATMSQLTYVLNQFSSQAHLTGESMAAMTAQAAVLIEAGEEQGKAGRALKQIYARLGADTSGAASAFQQLGIATHEADGGLRPLSHILADLNQLWPELTEAQRQNLVQTVAGNRHYTRLIKLVENYDRGLQLQLDAELALFPAMDEVRNRTEDSIIAYRAAEAELHKYQAAIGDNLLPALTAGLEKQAQFNKVVAEFTSNDVIGGAIGNMVVFGRHIENLALPIINMVIQFRQMSVAMQTMQIVQRALNGEEIIRQDAYGQANKNYQNMTATIASVNQVKQEELTLLQWENRLIEMNNDSYATSAVQLRGDLKDKQYEITLADAHITKLKEERQETMWLLETKEGFLMRQREGSAARERNVNAIERLKGKIKEQNVAIEQELVMRDRLIQELKEYAEMLGFVITMEKAEDQSRNKEKMDALGRQVTALHKLSGGFMMAGSAMMMFRQSDKGMRSGIMLTTVGMGILAAAQIRQAYATYVAEVGLKAWIGTQLVANHTMWASIGASLKNMATKIAEVGIVGALSAAYASLAAAAASATAATGGLSYALSVLATAVLSLIVAVVALLGLEKAMDRMMSKAMSKMNYDLQQGVVHIGDLQDAMHSMGRTTTEIQGSVTRLQEEIAIAEKDKSDTQKEYLQSLYDELALEERILALKNAQVALEAGASDQAMNDLVALYGEAEDLQNEFGTGGLWDWSNFWDKHMIPGGKNWEWGNALGEWFKQGGGLWGETAKEQVEANAKAWEELAEVHPELADFIETNQIRDAAELAAALKSNASAIDFLSNAEKDYLGMVIDGYTDANDALMEFSDNREALFYGLSSQNLTGDLVRQVVQKGVENLISNTEVVMTNNFNGLTTREAANEILDEIERGAGIRGMNLSLN